jgi:MFS family permease
MLAVAVCLGRCVTSGLHSTSSRAWQQLKELLVPSNDRDATIRPDRRALPFRLPIPGIDYFAGLVVLGFLVQLLPIPAPAAMDELVTWSIVRQPFAVITDMTAADVHPPVYYWLAACWASVFGSSLTSLRALSGVLGSLTIVVLWNVLGRVLRAEGKSDEQVRRCMLLAVAMQAFGFSSLCASHCARMYALMELVALCSFWSLWVALYGQRRVVGWALFGILSALLPLIHNFGLLFVAGEAVWLLTRLPAIDRRHRLRLLAMATCALGTASLLFLPWLPVLLRQTALVSAQYWIENHGLQAIGTVLLSLVYPVAQLPLTPFQTSFFIGVAGLLFVCMLNGRGTWNSFLAVQVVIYFVATAGFAWVTGQSVVIPRYFICLLPFSFIWIATTIGASESGTLRAAAIGLLLMYLVGSDVAGLYRDVIATERAWNLERQLQTDVETISRLAERDKMGVVVTTPMNYLRYCYHCSGSQALPWFWNPQLLEKSHTGHVEFLCIVPSNKYLDSTRMEAATPERIAVVGMTYIQAVGVPEAWHPEPCDIRLEGFGESLRCFQIR